MSLTFADTLRKEIADREKQIADREEEIKNILLNEETMYNYVTEIMWKKSITRELRKSKNHSIKFNLFEQTSKYIDVDIFKRIDNETMFEYEELSKYIVKKALSEGLTGYFSNETKYPEGDASPYKILYVTLYLPNRVEKKE
jgi:hypothetical protein